MYSVTPTPSSHPPPVAAVDGSSFPYLGHLQKGCEGTVVLLEGRRYVPVGQSRCKFDLRHVQREPGLRRVQTVPTSESPAEPGKQIYGDKCLVYKLNSMLIQERGIK